MRRLRDEPFSPPRRFALALVGVGAPSSAARARRGGTRRWTRRTIPKFRVAPGVRVVRETSVANSGRTSAVSKFGRRSRAGNPRPISAPGGVLDGGIVGRRGWRVRSPPRSYRDTPGSRRPRRGQQLAAAGVGGAAARAHRRGVTEITQNETAAAGGRDQVALRTRRTHRVRRVGRPRDAKCVDAR